MRISCSEFAFRALPGRDERFGIVAFLGFQLVDIALFLSHGAELVASPRAVVKGLRGSLERFKLASEDIFFTVGESAEEIALNHPDPSVRQQRRKEFLAAAQIASELEIAGLTILPGMTWAGDSEQAWNVCAEELAWRIQCAAALGVEVRIEPHMGSIVPTPESVMGLCNQVPGLRIALDAAHFVAQDVALDRVLTLLPITSHVHVRAAKPGAVQVAWRANETDFGAIVGGLVRLKYPGAFCVEYVPMTKWRCDEVDVVTETLATREALMRLGDS